MMQLNLGCAALIAGDLDDSKPRLAQALRIAELAIAALGAVTFKAEFTAGKDLSRDAALGLALGKHPDRAATASRDASTGVLGKREAEIARLITSGLTNKQIGAHLFISGRTVDSHVRSILNKLGFSSRAQIAAWMASPDQ